MLKLNSRVPFKLLSIYYMQSRYNIHENTTHFNKICSNTCGSRSRTRLSKLQTQLQTEDVGLFKFLNVNKTVIEPPKTSVIPYIDKNSLYGNGKLVYFETYGCQMNDSDTEVAWSILKAYGYERAMSPDFCDIALLMTCAVREGAESKIYARLNQLNSFKMRRKRYSDKHPYKIGLLGCMAERLKSKLLNYSNGIVDIVCGPDALRDLPNLISSVYGDMPNAVNVALSIEETYSDIVPVRLDQSRKTAYISIMRGCDNMCTYCIIPFTRGRERSRNISTILDEAKHLIEQGVKEICLVGQNVNSYRDLSEVQLCDTLNSKGFNTIYKNRKNGIRFDTLLDKISQIDPEFLDVINDKHNICNQIHIPAQSGSTQVLKTMNRGYTREAYLELIHKIKDRVKDVVLSSDFIAGFCNETEENHQETMQLLRDVRYNHIYVFPYSMREKTKAHYRLVDDVDEAVKKRRHMELANLYREIALEDHIKCIGSEQLMMVEDVGKRSKDTFYGATEGGVRTIIPNNLQIPDLTCDGNNLIDIKKGDYIAVKITKATSQTFNAQPLYKTTLKKYHGKNNHD
ncbi:hypothetical protein A3Q56_04508 [Intoshia linei]|uniref:CDK5 regulatory subunit-associated protein 1 n=1 Tax=Intoshia linei TaxID=1819745 RepID=A0A177B0G4_9BILA|nr:hypothetical protein A3Q56_04508 [Intoshia linei]